MATTKAKKKTPANAAKKATPTPETAAPAEVVPTPPAKPKRGKRRTVAATSPTEPPAAPAPPLDATAPADPAPSAVARLSALDAAAVVLAASDTPMRAVEIVVAMQAKGLWTSPGGKTPEATLYAGIIREIVAKGEKARFKKADRGMFVATAREGEPCTLPNLN